MFLFDSFNYKPQSKVANHVNSQPLSHATRERNIEHQLKMYDMVNYSYYVQPISKQRLELIGISLECTKGKKYSYVIQRSKILL